MYNPVSGGFLSQFFFNQRVLVSEEFHGEFVVGRLEEGHDLITQVVGRRVGGSMSGLQFAERRHHLLLRRAVQTDVVSDVGERTGQVVDVLAAGGVRREVRTGRDVVADE